MGEFPARIAAEDFVTPPEFADWKLALDGAGRIGGARIDLQVRAQTTQIARLYEQIPVRVLPLNLGPSEPTLVYLVNPTGGLMDGDAHLMEIHAGPGTRSVVTGQSATRIHPCLKGFCTQQWRIMVADNAILVVLPGPAIPFAGSRFFQSVHIELGSNAQLIWGDLWFGGRYSRNEASERFQFDQIVQEMLVNRAGRLVYRDRFCWQGPWDDETAAWHFGGFPAAGTQFATGTIPMEEESPSRAKFTTAAGDTVCRWTGSTEAVVHEVVNLSLHMAAILAKETNGKAWLLDGNHLAPTHWFDVSSVL